MGAHCDIKVLEDVKQRYLETVLPAEGGEVLVVDGNHAGERGKVRPADCISVSDWSARPFVSRFIELLLCDWCRQLLQKSSKSQMAAVQLHDTMEIVKVRRLGPTVSSSLAKSNVAVEVRFPMRL